MIQILFAWVLAAGAVGETPLDWRALDHVERFVTREHKYGVLPGHESVVRVRRDPDGVRLKTPYAVVVTSGLFNSPASMRPFEDYFAARKLNVVSLRLAGHYEVDRDALDRGVRWQTWKTQGERALALAEELGDQVLLVGHSTGALLSTWLAVENPSVVAGVGLFAPAFGLHAASGVLVSLLHALGFGGEVPRGRYVTGHAANQVRRMGYAFFDAMAADGRDPLAHVAERLADVPVWMANTSLDRVIDLKLAQEVFAELERRGRAPRDRDLRPACERLIHDRFASARNPQLPILLGALGEFLLKE